MSHSTLLCRAPLFKAFRDQFSLWSSNKKHHIKPVFLHYLPSENCSHFANFTRSVGRNCAYRILISAQQVSSCRDDLRFDPTVCPVLHNFPLGSILFFVLVCLSPVNRSYMSPCFLSSHFFSLISHSSWPQRSPCLCAFLYRLLFHYNTEKPGGCLYSPEDVEVIWRQEKLSLSHFNQLVGRRSSRKFTSKLLQFNPVLFMFTLNIPFNIDLAI